MLRMLRREDRHRLKDRVTVTRGSHPNVTTVATGVPAVVRPSQRATVEVSSGGQTVAMHAYDIRVPVATDARRGDVLTVTSSPDGNLVGRWLTVHDVVADSEQTSRVLVCWESRE